uniref:Uncharacterized protein n=1 Tax=Craspedostauros australis TaxID=1486917 RepID=A0A7S0F795_9STRA|mmetsp:Transcript_9909/g.27059  ORF Transcript_9909/g.27059 Transcript_9909/m.27059 type:complete len:295 (+) Transcript_9909:157-1041(+)
MAVIGHTEARATSASMTATALSSAPSALAAPTATLPFPLPLPPPSCERPRGRLRSADADFRTGTYPSPPPSSVSSAQSFRSLQSSRSHPVRMNSRPVFIDNTTRVYIPVHLPCGVEVRCCPDVFKSAPLVLRSLQIDLSQCLKVLPWSVHHLIRRTRIWLNNSYVYGDLHNPNMLRHTTTHHDETWLVECAHDIPEKACDVEIYNCMDYEQTRLHWNGCGLILHELCHVLHQHVLEDGLDNESVMAAFDTAKKSGLYNQCLRRDWAGQAEDTDTGKFRPILLLQCFFASQARSL